MCSCLCVSVCVCYHRYVCSCLCLCVSVCVLPDVSHLNHLLQSTNVQTPFQDNFVKSIRFLTCFLRFCQYSVVLSVLCIIELCDTPFDPLLCAYNNTHL